MRLLASLLVLLSCCFLLVCCKPHNNNNDNDKEASFTLRVLSYNIRSGSNIDNVYNISRTAATIKSYKPMLVGLQEVDNNTARHPGDDQPAILAAKTGLAYRYAKFRNFEGGGYGIAILSALPIEDTIILYYNKPGYSINTPPSQCSNPQPRDYCQGALAIRVSMDIPNEFPIPVSGNNNNKQKNGVSNTKVPLWFATTHLEVDPRGQVQVEEVKQLLHFLSRLTPKAPVILTGDFNSKPTSEAIRLVVSDPGFKMYDVWHMCGVGPGFTYNSSKPFERIDYVFLHHPPGPDAQEEEAEVRRESYLPSSLLPLSTFEGGDLGARVNCFQATVENTQSSDHRPVLALFSVRP